MASLAIERTPMERFTRYWLPVLIFVCVIIGFSAQPHLKLPFKFRNSDKVAHMGEYFCLGFLLARAWWHTLTAPRSGKVIVLALACGIFMAACDEKFQSFIPGRESTVTDAIADTIGVTLALFVYLLMWRRGEPGALGARP